MFIPPDIERFLIDNKHTASPIRGNAIWLRYAEERNAMFYQLRDSEKALGMVTVIQFGCNSLSVVSVLLKLAKQGYGKDSLAAVKQHFLETLTA